MILTGLIAVIVHSTDVMTLPVLSEVLKFVLASGFQHSALAAMLLVIVWFQTRVSHCPFHGVLG